MAKHDVDLRIASDIPVGNKDVEFPVKVDGTLLGRLKISRGGVEWLAANKSKRSHSMTWEKLAEIMARDGRAL